MSLETQLTSTLSHAANLLAKLTAQLNVPELKLVQRAVSYKHKQNVRNSLSLTKHVHVSGLYNR